MLLKILLIIAVIAVIYFVFFKKKPLQKNTPDTRLDDNDMVACQTCGTYCAIDEAILSGGKYYCSDACLEKQK